MFTVDQNVSSTGTSLVAEVDLAPAFLVARFGSPLPGDGYRVTGQYRFVGTNGEFFTVYDYKQTAAYIDDEDDALPPEQFWASEVEQELSVGGRGRYHDGSAKPFIDWLLAEYRLWRSSGG